MSATKKLTPPADAPKIPKGWVYKGPKFRSEKPIPWAYWNGGDEWYGVDCCIRFKLEPWEGCHYITPAPKRAKKKAQGKVYKFTLYVEGASSKEAAKTAVLVAFGKRGPDGCVFHLRTSSAIGVKGGRK